MNSARKAKRHNNSRMEVGTFARSIHLCFSDALQRFNGIPRIRQMKKEVKVNFVNVCLTTGE